MNNNDKREFLKATYRASRFMELMNDEEINNMQFDIHYKNIPKKLYKYRCCNDNNFNALINKKAWFSDPNTWNDQIDSTANFNLEKDLKRINTYGINNEIKLAIFLINNYIESYCEQKRNIQSFQLKEIYLSSIHECGGINLQHIVQTLKHFVGLKVAQQIAVKTQEAVEMVRSRNITESNAEFSKLIKFNELKDKFIMYSLSERYNIDSLWAHYADEGKGFCIEYNIKPKNKREISLIRNLLPIYYGKKKMVSLSKIYEEAIEFNIRKENIDDIINLETENLFLSIHTKEKCWNYEKEWRFSIVKEEGIANLVDFDFANKIYLGNNISPENELKLLQIAKSQNLSVYKKEMNNEKFAWNYKMIYK